MAQALQQSLLPLLPAAAGQFPTLRTAGAFLPVCQRRPERPLLGLSLARLQRGFGPSGLSLTSADTLAGLPYIRLPLQVHWLICHQVLIVIQLHWHLWHCIDTVGG